MAAAEGWDRPEVYTTLRMADVDGDGRSDVCAREPAGIRCWLSSGRAFDRPVEGPRLSDAEGWNVPERFRSIRLADVDGDGRADICARAADGLRCSMSTGAGFDRTWIAVSWSDEASELGSLAGVATIRIAGGVGLEEAPSDGGSGRDGIFGGCAVSPRGSRAMIWLVGAILALLLLRRR